MSNQWHRVILALAATAVAAGAWAQSAPDAPGGAGPDASGGPPRAWHGGDERGGDERGAHGQWGGDDGDRWHHHDHGGWGGRAGDDGEGGAGHGHDGMLFRGLNLTPEQHQKIRIIIMSARLDAMKQAATHKPDDMAALMNPGDPGYKAAVEAAKKRAVDRIQRMSDVKLQIYNVLTPEQKAELSKRIADLKARMAQRQQNPKVPPAPAAR